MAESDLDQLVAVWLRSPESFAESFSILDKDRNDVRFHTSAPQRIALDNIGRFRLNAFLKGRQMWITTICLVEAMRTCLRLPGAVCSVAMQSIFNARQICAVAADLHSRNDVLPHAKQLGMRIKRQNDQMILFENGSRILFVSANSPVLRSMAMTFCHLSEVREYDDLGEVLASVKVAKEGKLIVESTAGGQDDFYALWQDKGSAFHKEFLCWRDHMEYRRSDPFPTHLYDFERKYIDRHGLSDEEANWWVWERRGLPLHKQPFMVREFPCTADEAFALSGDKFLRRQAGLPAPGKPPDYRGVVRYAEYNPTHQYVCGIDPSPGSSEVGDPTGLVILDVTVKKVVVVQEVREPDREFQEPTLELLRQYGMPLTVIETMPNGLGLCDWFRSKDVPMYHMVAFGGLSPEMMPRHGWRTDQQTRPVLYGYIYHVADPQNDWKLSDRRLVTQCNALCYNKKGNPGAPRSGHDDLPVALGLAYAGVEQALPAAQSDAPLFPEKSRLQLCLEMAEGDRQDADHFDSLEPGQPGDFFY